MIPPVPGPMTPANDPLGIFRVLLLRIIWLRATPFKTPIVFVPAPAKISKILVAAASVRSLGFPKVPNPESRNVPSLIVVGTV